MRLVSNKDIIIPKGTIFECVDGWKTHYVYDNYECILALDNDTCATMVISSENKEYFSMLDAEYKLAGNPRFKHICHNT